MFSAHEGCWDSEFEPSVKEIMDSHYIDDVW